MGVSNFDLKLLKESCDLSKTPIITKTHEATTDQIALAWVTSRPLVITIPMSAKPKHIKENYKAADIKLSRKEIEQLNNG